MMFTVLVLRASMLAFANWRIRQSTAEADGNVSSFPGILS